MQTAVGTLTGHAMACHAILVKAWSFMLATDAHNVHTRDTRERVQRVAAASA